MLYFIDESGHDHGASPYEVLAAVAVQERELWNLIQAIRDAELEFFGVRFAEVGIELKGTKLLKRKTFRLAGEGDPIAPVERRQLTRDLVQRGYEAEQTGAQARVSFRELVAYGQSALAFVERVFHLLGRYRVKTFAAIVDPAAPRPPGGDYLRRDYAFLFERFYYQLESASDSEMGLIVFDELDKARSRILLGQMGGYFLRTEVGYRRSARIVPEPFFVHSDLTTTVQLADLVAYCASWGIRLNHMTKPVRGELAPFARLLFDLRYVGRRFDQQDGHEWPVYGMFYPRRPRPHARSRRVKTSEGNARLAPDKASAAKQPSTAGCDNVLLPPGACEIPEIRQPPCARLRAVLARKPLFPADFPHEQQQHRVPPRREARFQAEQRVFAQGADRQPGRLQGALGGIDPEAGQILGA